MDKITAQSSTSASAILKDAFSEQLHAEGRYVARCYDKDGNLKWEDHFDNLVTTGGKNDMLDKYLAGSSYTATMYMGLIAASGYVGAPVATDNILSHPNWSEAGGGIAPAYSSTTRPAITWSAAASGSKSMSSPITFTFTSAGTIKGSCIFTNSTKDGNTGVLFSAGLFSNGDKVVASGDTVQVSYSLSV